MSTDITQRASADTLRARRAKVAPLLATGRSMRVISAETGIPVGAVHRAKRQIEKARAREAPLDEPPPSVLVKRVANGVRQDFRRLTFTVHEQKVTSAIRRGLLQHSDRGDPGAVISALFAACFSDRTINCLHQRGYLPWADRGIGEAIIAAVNELIGRGR